MSSRALLVMLRECVEKHLPLKRELNRRSKAGKMDGSCRMRSWLKRASVGICIAGYLQPLLLANPLGLTVKSIEEARPWLVEMRLPSLGPRRGFVVVTAVDASGPCKQIVPVGFALQRIDDRLIKDTETFDEVTATLRPGATVNLKGLYAQQGMWRSGTASISIPHLPAPPSATSTGTVADSKPEPSSAQPVDRSPVATKRKGRSPDGRIGALNAPYLPFRSHYEGYERYGVNDECFKAMDYRKGPHGESIFTLYASGTQLGRRTGEAIEGYVIGSPSPSADMSADTLQQTLSQADVDGRFHRHGRHATFFIDGDVPTVEEHSAHHSGVMATTTESDPDQISAKPCAFRFWFADEPHGLSVEWAEDGSVSHRAVYVHGVVHSQAIDVETGGETVYHRTYQYGLRHGTEEAFYADGKRESQLRFIDGEEEGPYTCWFRDGTVSFQCTYRSGDREGVAVEYHPNGRKKGERIWKAGRMISDEVLWDVEGNLIPGTKAALYNSHTSGNSVESRNQFVTSGETVAREHLKTMSASCPPQEYQRFFEEFFLRGYMQKQSQMLEYPSGSNGYEAAKGYLEGYRSIMGGTVQLP